MIIELSKVGKSYINPGTNIQRDVLQDINLNISKGDSLAIVGPSGSGKSTLLNILGTLDLPTTGTVKFKSDDITAFDEKRLAQIRNQSIGFVFQFHHLLPQLSLIENVLVPTIPLGGKASGKEVRAMELLESFGLKDRIHQRPAQLSGGECQRTALVRALINEPEIILADEPTGSLDQDSAAQLGELLLEINKKHNVALVVVTHSLTLAEKMKTIYRLSNGRLE